MESEYTMPLLAMFLVILSSVMHAGWNTFAKSQSPSAAFFFFGRALLTILLLPLLLYWGKDLFFIPREFWKLLWITGFFMALYYAATAGAYRSGDVSLAYPLSRSMPTLMVPLFFVVIGRSSDLTALSLFGMILVSLGCFMMPIKSFRNFHIKEHLNLCCLFAVFAAVGYSGYSIIDDASLRILRELTEVSINSFSAAVIFIILQGVTASLWLSIFILSQRKERAAFRTIIRSEKMKALWVVICIYSSYFLVLIALAYARNVSYVVAFRQLSIPLCALFGIWMLKEPPYLPKLYGVVIIFTGMIFVGIG